MLYAAMYSGERSPYSPADLLYAWWSHADDLAGYKQQDAHEFYLSLLSAISALHIAPQVPPPSGGFGAGGAGGKVEATGSMTPQTGPALEGSQGPGVAQRPGQAGGGDGVALVSRYALGWVVWGPW